MKKIHFLTAKFNNKKINKEKLYFKRKVKCQYRKK